jgi:16S rRNA (cytidine1402-2'-O)-methyltransferase
MPLVFVPTPLGNLRDVTLRALDVLRDAQLIVAEDTRTARKLLAALEIGGREMWSYREQNADRTMPGISDPGSTLIAAARAAGVAVEVLPGPSAALGVALLSGFPLRRFTFEGFPPRGTRARRERFAGALRTQATTIWYESPQRIGAALADLAAVAPDADVFLVREYTKLHEQQLWGTPQSVRERLGDIVRGELSFAIAPYRDSSRHSDEHLEATDEQIEALLASGRRVGDVAKLLAQRGYGDRRELYARVSERKR